MRKLLMAALAALSLGVANEAGAVVYTIKYFGTVSSGSSTAGFLGSGSLAQQSFVATFGVDTSLPGLSRTPGPPHAQVQSTSSAGPITFASLKVGAFTYVIPTSTITSGGMYESHVPSNDDIQHFVNRSTGWLYAGVYSTVHDFVDGVLSTAPVSYTATAGDIGYGSFQLSQAGLGFASGLLTTTSYTVTSGGVPEPVTWSLMIAGFGLCGGAIRARRRAAA